jgi:hypothetical protein
MRKNPFSNNYYEVDFGLTLLFNQIYGEDEYYSFKENSLLSDYKKQFIKLIKTIQNAFISSCFQTSTIHITEIKKLVEEEINNITRSKDVETIYKNLVIFYPKLLFLIIGEIPQNSQVKKKLSNKSNWTLNKYRQISYIQNDEQKYNLLIKILENNYFDDLESLVELRKKFSKDNKQFKSFTEWFKNNFPIHYIKIFDL